MRRVEKPATLTCSLHTGICEQAIGYATADILRSADKPVHILLAPDMRRFERWMHDLRFFLHEEKQPIALHRYTPLESDTTAQSQEDHYDRLAVLDALVSDRKQTTIILSTLHAIFQPTPARDTVAKQRISLKNADALDIQALAELLASIGYANEALCEAPGDFSVRGGILDVYPINAEMPCRIDFFGDEIESLRAYDPNNQRTTYTLKDLTIAPLIPEVQPSLTSETLIDFLPPSTHWIMLEPETQETELRRYFQVPEKLGNTPNNLETLWLQRPADCWTGICELDTERSIFGASTHAWTSEPLNNYRSFPYAEHLGLERLESERKARIQFVDTLSERAKNGYHITFVSAGKAEQSRLQDLLKEEGTPEPSNAKHILGDLTAGFIIEAPRKPKKTHIYVTRAEVFGNKRRAPLARTPRKRVQRTAVDHLLDFKELADADPLVHLQHGVCLYRGLHTMQTNGKPREVIKLEFDAGHTLYLPLHESHLLSRYVGLSKIRPKLGKPGSNQWAKTRAAAEKATLDYASELLSTQAKRQTEPGHAFAEDTPWQREFEAAFPYRETPDQTTAIEDTKLDMENALPMDRLLCGDVGFGKTEVALRAAFKAVMDGHQVAMLVPTTILTQQHFNTFRERMADYPIVVEMLSRFRKPAQRTRILKQLKDGAIDIIIGTHALLGSKIGFNRLGLLIIDEEHRFGVRHKEQLKRMRANVDILSMSATPIPRTLYLALMGARNLSVIETAPTDRLPIETIVKNYAPELVKTAIEREVSRGGQVFYLHNRVQSIDAVARHINEMLPHVRIGVGHGQMDEKQLEKVMTEFVEGRYDVLVCTTIIENGLDIPNCNTILIEGADRFGLSQLYQLRGRVGRFKRQAYAYLLLHRHSGIVEQARKRLSSLRQHNQLGAGFRIAMRDLELRGAGHLLGDKQSGFIAGVGFDLYCQLLRQSIARLKGEPIAARVRAQMRIDFIRMGESLAKHSEETRVGYGAIKDAEIVDGFIPAVDANIPTDYIAEAQLRIDFYRQLALAQTRDAVDAIAEDLRDRFGAWKAPVEALLQCSHIRILAEEKGISMVETEGNRLKCHLVDKKQAPFIKVANRFPRLTSKNALSRLKEIITFLQRQPDV